MNYVSFVVGVIVLWRFREPIRDFFVDVANFALGVLASIGFMDDY